MKRRDFIKGGAAAYLLMQAPHLLAKGSAQAAASNKKVVWVFLRGALDALHTVIPITDPDLPAFRKNLIAPIADTLLPLNRDYSLHPKLSFLHNLYQQQRMSPVVAVASGYRERSHFEAQDQMESGLDTTDHDNGWLARAANAANTSGIAISRSVPIALRGEGKHAETWYPSTFPEADEDLLNRLSDLYQTDAGLNTNLQSLIAQKQNPAMQMQEERRPNFVYLAERCGELLKNDPNTQCAMLELGGWDTHNNQQGRLARLFEQLDLGLQKMHSALGESWQDTLVIINTEFGRTVALNGTQGTDHGTASTMFFAGGALAKFSAKSTVQGKKVLGTWPGLAKQFQFDGRDLMPTSDVRYWIKEALKEHWQIPENKAKNIFPDFV